MQSDGEGIPAPTSFTSHGKLLLFGEHAAVYGYPALGVSLEDGIELQIAESPSGHIFPGLEPQETDAALHLLESIETFLPGLEIPPTHFTIESSVTRSSGFGSSAAVCVALAKFLYSLAQAQAFPLEQLLPKFQISSKWPEDEQRNYEIWAIANHLERTFHGHPSGIDTGLSIHSGLSAFFPRSRKLPDILEITRTQPSIPIVYGAIVREGITKTLVGELQKAMLEEKKSAVLAMEKLGDVAHEAIELVQNVNISQNDSIEQIGRLATNAQEILEDLNLSTANLDAILEKGKKLGCTGGKLSGAGGGGAFYLICESQAHAGDIREHLTVFCRNQGIELTQQLRALQI